MNRNTNFIQVQKELQKAMGERAYTMTEAPPMEVISTGLFSLDAATGIGG